MKIFITCMNALGGMGEYSQVMVSDIAHQLGFRNMGIYFYNSRGESDLSLSARYDGIIASICRGDIVFFQHPTWHPLKYEEGLINRIKGSGGRVVIVIHDIRALMIENECSELEEAINLYNSAEVLIVPSFAMKKFLLENGVGGGREVCSTGNLGLYYENSFFTDTRIFKRNSFCRETI